MDSSAIDHNQQKLDFRTPEQEAASSNLAGRTNLLSANPPNLDLFDGAGIDPIGLKSECDLREVD